MCEGWLPAATGMLERECADGLAAGHLRALLAYLCDEALDAEAMREAMDSRLGEAHEAGVALRKAAAEENARIKAGPVCVCLACYLFSARHLISQNMPDA